MTLRPVVFLREPLPGLARVPAAAPVPESAEDPPTHAVEGVFTRGMTMVHRPALDLLVQTMNQLACRPAPCLANGLPEVTQESPHVRPRWFHQYLAAAITAQILTQEIEAVLALRDPGFLVA